MPETIWITSTISDSAPKKYQKLKFLGAYYSAACLRHSSATEGILASNQSHNAINRPPMRYAPCLSSPISSLVSDRYVCGGTSRLIGAGEPL